MEKKLLNATNILTDIIKNRSPASMIVGSGKLLFLNWDSELGFFFSISLADTFC